ncbi:glycosyltransferase family 2 protein, partial [Paralimibaculum aggregatum]|uniref:glycosyltransferase family 2 protein n=1 Tax=Paralimibaculum aggregatum TaxID=3036245 RepID=UPI002556CFD9
MSTSAAPRFSVLCSAYNAEATLEATVASVLAQSCGDFELLITDDGSTDGTLALARRLAAGDPRIRVLAQDNAGKSVAMNAMIAAARGAILVMQDADDLSPPERLAVLAGRFDARPELGLALSGYALLWHGHVVAPRVQEKSPADCAAEIAQMRSPGHDATIAVRREIAAGFGFEPALRTCQGMDFILRVGEAHPMEVIGRCLLHYRISMTSNTRAQAERRARMIKLAHDRARTRRGLALYSWEAFDTNVGALARDPHNQLHAHFTDSAFLQMMAGDRRGALATALFGLRHLPWRRDSLKPVVYALAPRALARRL